jgi:hypothetical protein
MEWVFSFWRKLRWAPASTLLDEADSTAETLAKPNTLVLGSVAGTVLAFFAGEAFLYASWGASGFDQPDSRWTSPSHADWSRFWIWALPITALWSLSAAWMSQTMPHPFFPRFVAKLLGLVFRTAVAVGCVATLYAAALHFNHNLLYGAVGGFFFLLVAVSTFTGAIGRWSAHVEATDDPWQTGATDYPFSYLVLCSFLLAAAALLLMGTPSKYGPAFALTSR